MAIIPRLDVSPVGFLFNDTLEQTKSFDNIYGNIVESDPKGVREKERNDGVAFRKFLILEAKVCLWECDEAGAGERVEGVSSPVKCNLLSSYLKRASAR